MRGIFKKVVSEASDRRLRRVVIPAVARQIAANAFKGLEALEEVLFEEGSQCEEICQGAFYGCGKLRMIHMPEGLRSIKGHTKAKDTRGAFQYCSELSSLVLPSTLEWIGDYSFYGCGLIETVAFPLGIAHIGHWAFHGTGLKRVEVHSKAEVGDGAFPNLTEVVRVEIIS